MSKFYKLPKNSGLKLFFKNLESEKDITSYLYLDIFLNFFSYYYLLKFLRKNKTNVVIVSHILPTKNMRKFVSFLIRNEIKFKIF